MYLFIVIIILCFLINVSGDFVSWLNIQRYWNNQSSDDTELQDQLKNAENELKTIQENPCMGEFTQRIKLSRAQEKIDGIRIKIFWKATVRRSQAATKQGIAGYGLKVIFSLILFIISIKNRYTPVMIFHEKINFSPLTGLLCFPTGIVNAISVPVWVLSCNVTISIVKNIIKKVTSS